MKKNQLLIAALVLAASFFSAFHASAQDDVKGRTFINAGIGIGTFGFLGTGGLPITGSVEYGFTDKISGGIYLGAVTRNYGVYYGTESKYKYIVAGARASYHFNEALNVSDPKVDLYGGASLYYRGYTWKYTDSYGKQTYTAGAVGLGIHIGGRYMFADKLGGFAEIGYGVSPLQLGLTVKL